jgi:4'-phosphopantetheinyl transferase EntD
MMPAPPMPLDQALAALARPGLLVGYRAISPEDARSLTPEEGRTVRAQDRAASGAARQIARELMTRLGTTPQPLPKGAGGAPRWPDGLVGSLAHDETVAIAAVAKRDTFAGIGIDIEPAESLDADMVPLVMTERERARSDDPFGGKLTFIAKEAVYKAVYPLDGLFLEFSDIDVDLTRGCATIRDGRVIEVRLAISTHLVALALA